jgi:hypothetical protein
MSAQFRVEMRAEIFNSSLYLAYTARADNTDLYGLGVSFSSDHIQ